MSRADVYSPEDVFRPTMCREPSVPTYALGLAELHGEAFEPQPQYVSSSLFPHPSPPVS
ncbi:MAG TPA: hypothetical protein VGM11_09570 [Acidobacteriaceae bacterium]